MAKYTKGRFYNFAHRAENGCLLWDGPQNDHGYGLAGTDSAHRRSYEITYGPFARELCVLHKCDNPLCVEPTHLFLGTQLDNMRDMRAKGRDMYGSKVKKNVQFGEAHHYSKLTTDDVRWIREWHAAGWQFKLLGPAVGVTKGTAANVCNGTWWKHVV